MCAKFVIQTELMHPYLGVYFRFFICTFENYIINIIIH